MTDEPSLLRLVRDHLAEPLPRLIYADWLDDIGEPLMVQKSAFLRLWCRLHGTPLSDLDGYPELAARLEVLKTGLPADWLWLMDGHRFQITNADAAKARARAFLSRILDLDVYDLHYPYSRDGGWIVLFSIMPSDEPAPTALREKEYKRGGPRKPKRTFAPFRRGRQPAYTAATPLFVERVTGRVDWLRGPTPTPPQPRR